MPPQHRHLTAAASAAAAAAAAAALVPVLVLVLVLVALCGAAPHAVLLSGCRVQCRDNPAQHLAQWPGCSTTVAQTPASALGNSCITQSIAIAHERAQRLVSSFHMSPTPRRCAYAQEFTDNDILTNETAFARAVVDGELRFHTPNVGYNAASGLTYDGHAIDQETGELLEHGLRDVTAASKESLHISLLALALQPEAPHDGAPRLDLPRELVLDILARKMASFEAFNATYPGFGGFLPWYKTTDHGIKVLENERWAHEAPSLDNGQLFWSLKALCEALRGMASELKLAASLRDRAQAYANLMAGNAVRMFVDRRTGEIAALVAISDPTSASPVYSNPEPGYALDDPFEGELFAMMVDLYAPDCSNGLRGLIWTYRQLVGKFQAASLPVVDGRTERKRSITVQRGLWFSAHEQWKYFVLPYVDSSIARRVFVNGERARTWYSAERGLPGLFASASNVSDARNGSIPSYVSACGVPPLASLPTTTDLYTPYAAFPVILANSKVGLVWLRRMLLHDRMQGPYGSTEAIDTSGRSIAPLVTWDSKMTTVVSILGGTVDLLRRALKDDGRYARFVHVVDTEYSHVFGRWPHKLQGEDLDFRLPTSYIPPSHGGMYDGARFCSAARRAVELGRSGVSAKVPSRSRL